MSQRFGLNCRPTRQKRYPACRKHDGTGGSGIGIAPRCFSRSNKEKRIEMDSTLDEKARQNRKYIRIFWGNGVNRR